MLESILDIFIITYNRSAHLDKTLRQLKDSPFAKCRLTVLDNCSTDETPVVSAKYTDCFPLYNVIRHNRNIGGDYNFLRAIELSSSLYTWILCDDDDYAFENVSETIDAIESCKYDLVYVASRSENHLNLSASGGTEVKQLVKDGSKYHRAAAFWPALIFKTEKFDKNCFINVPYLFPSLKFINKSIVDNFSIFISPCELVIRSEVNPGEIHALELYKEWVANAAQINDKKLKKFVIDQWTDKGFFKTLIFWIALDKANRTQGYWKRLVDIMFGLTPLQRLKLMLLVPIMVIPIPKCILVKTREILYRLMGQKNISKLPPIDCVIRN